VLLKLLITKIFPSKFEQQLAKQNYKSIWESQIDAILGGKALLQQKLATHAGPITPTIAYLCPDESRDAAAVQLLGNNQIEMPSLEPSGLVFVCHSSLALDFEKNPVSYKVKLRLDQLASCKCQDFVTHGGACKHIRAALLRLHNLRSQVFDLPNIQLPSSADDARILQARQFSELLMNGQMPSTIAPPMLTPMEHAATVVEDELHESDNAYSVDPENPQQNPTEDWRAEEDSESDDESVATDVPDDNECNSSDFTSLQGTSKFAFDEQTVACIFYELEGAALKLGGLGTYLKYCTSLKQLQDFEHAVAFCWHLDSLHEKLTHLITHYICQDDTQDAARGPSQIESTPSASHP